MSSTCSCWVASIWGGLIGLLTTGLWLGGGSPLGVWQFFAAAVGAELAGAAVLWRMRVRGRRPRAHWLPPSAPYVPVAAFAVLAMSLGVALGFWAMAMALGFSALAAVLLQRHLKQRPTEP
ncbi:MAG: hypothetical protein M0Z87_03685 [Actinomycetota bacterium]|nr:hypothetical protein [Actinomycetota bacterium]